MKKLSVLFITVIFFVVGCISFQLGGEEKEVIAKITARRVGHEIQKQYPDIAKQVKNVCQKIIDSSGDIKKAVNSLTDLLPIDDALLKADIRDLLSLIKIEADVEVTRAQKELIRIVADNLQKGMEVCNER